MRALSRGTPFSVVAALGLSVLLGACGQGTVEPSSDSTSRATESSEAEESSMATQPGGEWSVMEMAVLEALRDDPSSKRARYEADAGRIVVTMYSEGEPLSEERLRGLQARAEEVTDGTPVVIETTYEDLPTGD